MNERQRAAFIVALVESLSEGGWVGKTHVQKTAYFAQKAADQDLGLRFVIHHYGPYAFELDSLLQTLESQGVLSITPELDGYGYRVQVGENAGEVEIDLSTRETARAIAGYFSGMQAAELELLSTAHYVRQRLPGRRKAELVRELRHLKPKFTAAQASQALDESAALAEGLASLPS